MTNQTQENFETSLEAWLVNAQKVIEDAHKRRGYSFECSSLEMMRGRRYVRVVRVDSGDQRSAHCFIDRTNGDVLKPAGWKGPAKNFARGNIYTKSLGVSEFGAHTCC